MPAEAVVHGPVTRAFANWLTAQGTSAGTVRSRWVQGALPQVTCIRVGGPDAQALLQLDCWHTSEAQAEALAAEMATAVEALTGATQDGVQLKGAAVLGIRSFNSDDVPRFICDIVLSAIAS